MKWAGAGVPIDSYPVPLRRGISISDQAPIHPLPSLTPPDPEELARAVPATTTAPIPPEDAEFTQETAL